METQRQWSDLAILRTTPCLLGLFSLTALMTDRLHAGGELVVTQSDCYEKEVPTFSDALAGVRQALWRHRGFSMSHHQTETLKIPKSLFEWLTSTTAYTA